MTLTLQIVFILVSILMFVFVIHKIRKSQLQIADAIAWIIGSIFIIILSLCPSVVMKVSDLLGFYSASNFIFSLFVFFLLIIVFTQNIKISILNEKLKNLNHYIALKEHDEKRETRK